MRQFGDALRQQTQMLAAVQNRVFEMSERLTRIESTGIHGDVEQLRQSLDAQTRRIDALMQDKDRRDGALGAWAWLQRSAPWAALMAAGAGFAAWIKD